MGVRAKRQSTLKLPEGLSAMVLISHDVYHSPEKEVGDQSTLERDSL